MDDELDMSGPFATIPEEILSYIFTEVCIDQWWAALSLGAVCSYWRYALLSTPRAWACIEITPASQIFNPDLLDLWLSRCGAIKLHISLDSLAAPEIVDVVCYHEEIIQCFSLFNNTKQLIHRFSQLEKPRLGPEECFRGPDSTIDRAMSIKDSDLNEEDIELVETCLLDVQRFPKLVSLHLQSPSMLTMEAISRTPSFPPLQELHIHAESPYWVQIIQCSAESLVSLGIEVPEEYFDSVSTFGDVQPQITLPYLQKLSYIIRYLGPLGDLQLPSIKTPNLDTYHERSLNDWAPFHGDTTSVTSVYLQCVPGVNWPSFPAASRMYLVNDVDSIVHTLQSLGDNSSLCPDLAWVECIPLDGVSEVDESWARQPLQRRSNTTKKTIEWRYTDSKSRTLFSMCFTFCNCDTDGDAQLDEYNERSSFQRGRFGSGGLQSDEEEAYDSDREWGISFSNSDESEAGYSCPFCSRHACSCPRWCHSVWQYDSD